MRDVRFKKSYLMLATAFLLVCGFFVSNLVNADALGDPITGLDVPDNVLQIGETVTRTATTTEDGASDWTSSATSTATIDPITGVVEAIAEGTTTIAYATSTSGLVNSIEITVYAAATVDAPAIGTVQVGEGDVTPTSFTAAGAGETISWQSSDTDIATIVAGTGVITPVAEGTTTISYQVEEDATGRIVAKGSLEITVLEEEEATLVSIAITTPADVLSYHVGDSLDITGLVVTGTYSDDSTSTEAITSDNITGFDSSEPEDNQVLTVTVGGKTATYTVDVIAIPITAIGAIIGTPQFGTELTAGALTPSAATATYQWRIAATSGGTYADIVGATSNTYTPVATDVTKYLKVVATGTGNYSGTVTSTATELGVAAISITAIGDITGTAKVGRTLTAGAVVPAGATVNYSWNRGNEANGTYNSIDGASSATYTLTAGDKGKFIRVRVTGRDGYSGEVMSDPTEAVAARNSGGSSSRSSGTTISPAGSQTIAQMQATVNLLIAQINALIAQAKAQGIQLTGISGAGGSGSPIVLSAVVRPLFLGVSGADVNALQNFLISQNKGAAAAALKNHGATNYFGPLTKAALAEFQAIAGLPATGYFGPLTKAYLKTLGF
jgi:peptidoglycan hydrolase-like protein with peptidoglycan-binding domain